MPSDAPAGTVTVPGNPAAARALLGQEAPLLRKPRPAVLINGIQVEPLEIEVVNNGFYLADTFRGRFHLDQEGPMPVTTWASEEVLEVEVVASDGVADETLIIGRVDDVDIDYDQRLVIVSGRDFTADLIETKTTEKWPNKTASDIVAVIAGRHGLKPVVTATTTTAGTYYSREHAALTDETTEWDLLTYLAEQEGFDLFVIGRELHFERQPDPASAPRWVIEYEDGQRGGPPTANADSLRLRRNLTVAREVVVKVVSWNAKQKRSFEVTRRADRTRRPRSRSNAPPRTFVFRVPQMTEQQAIEYADRKLREISQAERTLDVTLAADLRVTARHVVSLAGTRTDFDQEYLIDNIVWTISFDGGFSMRMVCRNLAPSSTVAL